MRRRTPQMPAFQRGLLRFAFGLVTSFIAVGYFASLVHMAFVAHTACSEHGGLVHVQDAAPTHGAVRDGAPTPFASRSDALTADEHDHCVLGMANPGEGRVTRTPLVILLHEDPVAASTPTSPHPSCERAEPPPQIALLFLSPKVSPPIRAL